MNRITLELIQRTKDNLEGGGRKPHAALMSKKNFELLKESLEDLSGSELKGELNLLGLIVEPIDFFSDEVLMVVPKDVYEAIKKRNLPPIVDFIQMSEVVKDGKNKE